MFAQSTLISCHTEAFVKTEVAYTVQHAWNKIAFFEKDVVSSLNNFKTEMGHKIETT